MSRRNIVYKTRLEEYINEYGLFNKFVNVIMKHGKKYTAERIMYDTFKEVKKKIKKEVNIEFLLKIVEKIKPVVEVKSRRIGGSTYQIPVLVKENRKNSLAIRWLINGARKRDKNKSMYKRLANEFIDALNEKGYAYKKREEVHRLAESNKAFAHYRW